MTRESLVVEIWVGRYAQVLTVACGFLYVAKTLNTKYMSRLEYT